MSIITFPVVESAFHAGFPRLGQVAHLNASPLEQFPQADGTEPDAPSATSVNLTMSSASSISFRPQLQFLQARFFGAQLSASPAAEEEEEVADLEIDMEENAAAEALSSNRESSSIKSAFAFKFLAADVHDDDATGVGRTNVTLDEIDDVVVSVDDFPSKAVVGKRVLSLDAVAKAGLFNTPVELSVTNPQRTASSLKTFFRTFVAEEVARSSPPGRSAVKALESRPRRTPSANAEEGAPFTSRSITSRSVKESEEKVDKEFDEM
jgi:hypothetical protein